MVKRPEHELPRGAVIPWDKLTPEEREYYLQREHKVFAGMKSHLGIDSDTKTSERLREQARIAAHNYELARGRLFEETTPPLREEKEAEELYVPVQSQSKSCAGGHITGIQSPASRARQRLHA